MKWNGAVRLVYNSVQIFIAHCFTVGSGIYSEPIAVDETVAPPNFCNVFQAEILAIQDTVTIIWDPNVLYRNITILHPI